jgi:hypothetical protein
MKNTLLTVGVAGFAALLLSSFVMPGNDDQTQKPRKSRHVRMVKITDGKKAVIDTVFTTDDVFVWQGDTINPMEHRGDFIEHGFRNDGKRADVAMFRHRSRVKDGPAFFDAENEDDMNMFDEENDSTGDQIIVRRIMKGKPGNHMFFIDDKGFNHFPPVPPAPLVPPVPHRIKFKHSGQIIDLNDPNVISYRKKDLSGGREKIEIIRKKADRNKMEASDFEFDGDNFMPPMPPEAMDAPDFDLNNERDSLDVKIIDEKKLIDKKNGKEIDTKMESPTK